ncbi:hypothetical protein K9N68_12290 [Kovacikia minuta CCNUW1]|uniref:hypothetical protein n=1 Tax=Kovacikia minuta TaxID=2931930 RepID=UPI001CC9EFE4|nr:hypothetical protein [Kovacikia minuta]UBF28579.1 hypothetical protein K9N68_12290 [Kovacikia minuta CCNUW1]
MYSPSLLQNIPTQRRARWQLLKEIVADWYPPLSDADGFDHATIAQAEQKLGLCLPLALKEWYGLAGRRADVWSRQDELIVPGELVHYRNSLLNTQERQSYQDALIFYVENQACQLWAIKLEALAMDDPPVVINPGKWIVNSQTTSEFVLQVFASGIKWSNPLQWIHGVAEPALLACVEENFPKLGLAEWWYWGRGTFYGFRDIVIEVVRESTRDVRIFVSARAEAAFEGFMQFISTDNFYCEASWDD